MRGHAVQCDAGAAGSVVLARLPGATLVGRSDAERHCQAWGRRPGLSTSSSGIRLRWIPPYQPFSQLAPPAGGSTVVSDSLDTKQVNTSGPAVVSCDLVTVLLLLTTAAASPYLVLGFLHYFLKTPALICGSIRVWRVHSESIGNALTCANTDGKCVQLMKNDDQNSLKLTPESGCVAPVVELCLLCRREVQKTHNPADLEFESFGPGSREP